jgi:hypothetical protein
VSEESITSASDIRELYGYRQPGTRAKRRAGSYYHGPCQSGGPYAQRRVPHRVRTPYTWRSHGGQNCARLGCRAGGVVRGPFSRSVPPAIAKQVADGTRALYGDDPDRFELIAAGSRDDWLHLKNYPHSTIEAQREVISFLAEQGFDVEDREVREYGRRLVRDAVDDVLINTNEPELKRMENAEMVFLAVQDDLARRGIIKPATAYERYRAYFGAA